MNYAYFGYFFPLLNESFKSFSWNEMDQTPENE